MALLCRADHVDHAIDVQGVDPVPDGGQVGRGVVEATVLLADDEVRRIGADQVNRLIAKYTEHPELGFLGEPRVNVLKLNLALDSQFPRR